MIQYFRRPILLLCLFWGATALLGADSLSDVMEQGRAEARQALSNLRDFRAQMQAEQLPLEKTIRDLRSQLETARKELRKLREAADSNDLALAELEEQVERLALASSTAETLLNDLIANQESAAWNQLDADYREQFKEWQDTEDGADKIEKSTPLVLRLVKTLHSSVGGRQSPLTIYSPEGKKIQGTGLFLGPLVYFSNGEQTGIVDLSDSSYPRLSSSSLKEAGEIVATMKNYTGFLPIDSTGGAALAIRKNSPNLLGEILRAGIWIYPILIAAAIALIVAIVKWFAILSARRAVQKARKQYPRIWDSGDSQKQDSFVSGQPALLRPFWETLWKTRIADADSRDDLLYARLIEIRLRLTKGLAALSVIAATTPLLGLLGTVTGMITTFQRITLFGTGDPQNLSGGISEALLTTKFGLIVAIPTFLLYAYLSRRAQGTVADLETLSHQFDPASKGGKPTVR